MSSNGTNSPKMMRGAKLVALYVLAIAVALALSALLIAVTGGTATGGAALRVVGQRGVDPARVLRARGAHADRPVDGGEPHPAAVRLQEFEPADVPTTSRPIVAPIQSLLFVIDTVNTNLINVARTMGVDVLIVVDAGVALQARERLNSIATVSNQAARNARTASGDFSTKPLRA